jgi:acyl-coenzyme A thioesterase PaaI-like protein
MSKSMAIQDRMQGNRCYGCGADNPLGLQIKSYRDGEETVCRYLPRTEQCAGPTQYLYGGTIASLIDCHSVGTAIADHYWQEDRDVGDGEEIWCVTGRLEVDYLAPTPIDQAVDLRAHVEERAGRKTIVVSTLHSGDTLCARGRVIAIRVPDSWRA